MDTPTINKACAALAVMESMPAPVSANVPAGKPVRASQGAPLKNAEAKALAEEIQQHLDALNISLSFSTYGKNKISITVTEKDTGRVIREIPSAELQSLYAKLDELAGMIFNEKA